MSTLDGNDNQMPRRRRPNNSSVDLISMNFAIQFKYSLEFIVFVFLHSNQLEIDFDVMQF